MDHRRARRGVLEESAAGYQTFLALRGMTPVSIRHRMSQWASLGRWLAVEGLTPWDLTGRVAERYVAARRAAGRVAWVSGASLTLPLAFLRCVGASPAGADSIRDADDELLADYCRYLREERGVADQTCRAYLRIADRFCSSLPSGWDGLAELTAAGVSRFMVASSRESSVALTKKTVTALASLLRYLFTVRVVSEPLWLALPKTAGGPSSPRRPVLSTGEVTGMLDACDPASLAGARDRAVITVLARLGLRAGEVAALTVDDVDWRHGEVTIHGKGPRLEAMPLPGDVGRAITTYLLIRRPAPPGCRQVFLRLTPPVGPLTSSAVSLLVRRVAKRVGLPPCGSHRLRHFAATTTLRAGASLPEVAELLRHRALEVTARYSLVEPAALRELAMPWPGGAS